MRIFIAAVFGRYRACGRVAGIATPEAGALTFVQRFGSSLNLNVHMHVVLLDGVFDRDEHGRVRFHTAPPPTHHEMDSIVRRVHESVVRWVDRHGRQGAPLSAALEACANIAVRRGTVSRTSAGASGEELTAALTGEAQREIEAVEYEGFNLDASVRIDGDDDLARERLLRYGARPPFALERFGRRADGSITYRIKKLAHGAREKVRVMTPLECLARLSSLIPPPRFPLLRYHGVLAPASKWRRDIVPKPRATQKPSADCKRKPDSNARGKAARTASVPQRLDHGTVEKTTPTTSASALASSVAPAPALPAELAPGVTPLAPNVLSVEHWRRLLDGRLLAPPARVDWACLLQRTFEVDVLACSRCGGRLRVLGEVTEPAMVRLVLESLAMPTNATRAARARDPTALLGRPDDE